MNEMSKIISESPQNSPGRKITLWLIIVIIVLFAITILAIMQQRSAEHETKIALARQFALQAQNILLSENPSKDTALLLAVLSMRLDPSGEAAQTLQNPLLVSPQTRTDSDGYISTLAFSPDGQYVVTGSEKHIARVWEISTGKEIVKLDHGDTPIFSLVFSQDSNYVVSGTSDPMKKDNIVRVWEVATGKEIARMEHDFGVNAVAISFDGKYVVSGGYDRLARVWEISTGREVVTLLHPGATVMALAFSPDGKYVVSGARDDYSVRVWEIPTGKEISHVTHDDYVTSVALSPDGKYVVAGCDNRGHSLRVWEAVTGKEISRMDHEYRVTSVAFSPDGKYVVSGSEDLTTRIWDFATGKEISRMAGTNVIAVAFSPDNQYVLSGDYYENITQWKWKPDDLINDACQRVTRNLMYAEWQKYIGSALPYQAICPNIPLEPTPSPVTIPVPTPF